MRAIMLGEGPGASPSRATDRVAEELRRMIITLDLPPGAVVSQTYLTERLRCGRTPLREALQRLMQEYLVMPVPGSGIAIAGLGVVDFADMLEALASMEGFSARLAARRIAGEDLARLARILAEAEAANAASDFSTVAERDFEFHWTVARATGNRYIADTIARLHRLATRFGYIGWLRAGTAQHSLREHREILLAFESRDPAEAERRTHEHTMKARERILSVL